MTVEPESVLDLPTAGATAIRGGTIRAVGYIVGTGANSAAALILLRHLGVVDWGRYATVTAIVAVVSVLTDSGVSVVGLREYVAAKDAARRRALASAIVGIRLILTPLGVGLALVFVELARYGHTMLVGTALAGAGAVLVAIGLAMTVPISAELRYGATAAVSGMRDATQCAGIVLLVVVGSGLMSFFVLQVFVGMATLALAVALIRDRRLHYDARVWLSLAVRAAPLGAALVVNTLYLRAVLIMTSLIATKYHTGLYATSDRIVQVVAGLGAVITASAFPIIARAAAERDIERLRNVVQQLMDTSLFFAGACILFFAVAAQPIVDALGGHAYAGAAPVLRIQGLALAGTFAGSILAAVLVALERQAALIRLNVLALTLVLVLGAALIPTVGLRGAAITAALGEWLLALATLAMLVRVEPELRQRLATPLKLAAAAVPGVALAFVPGLPALGAACGGVVLYAAVAWSLDAVPRDITHALLRRL